MKKLIHFYGEGAGKDENTNIDYFELYDLEKDPHEMKNIYNEPTSKEQVDKLKAELKTYQVELNIEEGLLE